MTENSMPDEPKSAAAIELNSLRLLIAAKRSELEIRIETAETRDARP